MISIQSKRRRVLINAEIVLCLGPTFIYLLTGVVLVPHQLQLLVREQVTESLWPLFYYTGTVALLIAVRAMYRRLVDPAATLPAPATSLACLAVGVGALCTGPVGAFALGGRETLQPVLVIPFLVLPLGCVLHLSLLSRDYLLRSFRSKA